MIKTWILWLGLLVVACGKGGGPAVPPSGIHPCQPAACEQLCARDDNAACARAAERYFYGTNGHPLDLPRSFELASKACTAGNGHGCTLRGLALQDGRGTAWDPAEAVRTYERACDLGAGTGCYNLGTMYAGGHGVSPDPAKAETYQQRAARAWQAACDGREQRWCTNAAFALRDPDTEAVRRRRLELVRRACTAGVDVGCTQVAIVEGELGTATADQVIRELERLCTAGEGGACMIAAARLFTSTPAEPRRAAELAGRACELGDAHGCEAMGTEAYLGENTPKDRAAAMRYFEMGCDRGLARACAKLANVHREDGRAADEIRFIRRACEMGDGQSCAVLGAMYAQGIGTPPSAADAERWLTEACRGGEPGGCAYLARAGRVLPLPDDLQRVMLGRLCSEGVPEACPQPPR